MKTFLILALLAVMATTAIATIARQKDPCKEFFLQQQCNPKKKMLQQGSCQVMQQQCCQDLAQIDVASRCQAIWQYVHSIIGTQQQQQLEQKQQQPWDATQLARTLQAMCNEVNIPPYCIQEELLF